MITREQYEHWKPLIEEFELAVWEDAQREADESLEADDPMNAPCPTCGEIDGVDNPCCAMYDPLSYKNCGYG